MPSMFKKAMLYLGLGSDEDFEALDRQQAHEGYEQVRTLDPTGTEVLVEPPAAEPAGPVDPDHAPVRAAVSAVRPIPLEEVPERARRQSVVRPLPAKANTKPHVVHPASFNDAQEIADHFKRDQPVIVDLQQADRDLMRRLIDFASGLCYGVGGEMKKVATAVYMLTPADVEVSEAERERLKEEGLYD